jgi:hypothetical protein
MPKATKDSAGATQPVQPAMPVGKDWPVVVDHLRTLAALPWTPKTSSALGQFVANIVGDTHGPHNRKRTPKPKSSGKTK